MSTNQAVIAELQHQPTLNRAMLIESLHALNPAETDYDDYVLQIRNAWARLDPSKANSPKAKPTKKDVVLRLFRIGGHPAPHDPEPVNISEQECVDAGYQMYLDSLKNLKPLPKSAREKLVPNGQALLAFCQQPILEAMQNAKNIHEWLCRCFEKFPFHVDLWDFGIGFSSAVLSLLPFNQECFERMVDISVALARNEQTLITSDFLIQHAIVPYIVQDTDRFKSILEALLSDSRPGNRVLNVLAKNLHQYRTDILHQIWKRFAKATDDTDSATITYWKNLSKKLLKWDARQGRYHVENMYLMLNNLEKNPQAKKLWYELMQDVCVPQLEADHGYNFHTNNYIEYRRQKFAEALKQYKANASHHFRTQNTGPLPLPTIRAQRWEVMKYDAEDINWLFDNGTLNFIEVLKNDRDGKWRELLNEIAERCPDQKAHVDYHLSAFELNMWKSQETMDNRLSYFHNELLPNFKLRNHNLTPEFKLICLGTMIQVNDIEALDHIIPVFCAENDTAIPPHEKIAVWKSLPSGCKKETKALLLTQNDVCTLIKDSLKSENPDWDGIKALLAVHPSAMIQVGDDAQLSMRQILNFSRAIVVDNKFPDADDAQYLNERVVKLLLLQNIEPVESATRANHKNALDQYNDMKAAYAAATRARSPNTRPLVSFILRNPTVTQQWLDASVALGGQNPFPDIVKVLPWMQAAMKADANGVPVANLAMLQKLSENKCFVSYAKKFYKDIPPPKNSSADDPVDERYLRALRILEDYADPVKNFFKIHWKRRYAKLIRVFLIEEYQTVEPKTEAALNGRLKKWMQDKEIFDLKRKRKEELGSFGCREVYLTLELGK